MLNHIKCFVLKGLHSRGEGFSLEEATGIVQKLHESYDHWIGQRVGMHCIPCTLWDIHGELKIARELTREQNIKRKGTP